MQSCGQEICWYHTDIDRWYHILSHPVVHQAVTASAAGENGSTPPDVADVSCARDSLCILTDLQLRLLSLRPINYAIQVHSDENVQGAIV